MRISDWSSDVCSSDLERQMPRAWEDGRQVSPEADRRAPSQRAPSSAIPLFPNPALITPWAGLHHPERQHRVGNLLESRALGALNIVDIAISSLATGTPARVNTLHDTLHHTLQFAPAQPP